MLKAWEIRLSGGLELRDGGGTAVKFRTRKAASLLALLASHPGRSYRRDELCEMFWPDDKPDSAKHNLRQTLTTLRSILEPAGVAPGSVLKADRTEVSLEPRAVSCDTHMLSEALKDPPSTERLEAAVQRIKGEFLAGIEEDWVPPVRALMGEHLLIALKTLVRELRKAGEFERAILHSRNLVNLNPLDEEAQATLIRLLAETGRPEDALHQYRDFRKLLKKEFGDEPDPGLTKLVLTLKGSHGTLAATSLDSVFQAKRGIHPLPPLLTKTFGRDEDISSLARVLLDDQGPRLVTLTGPGGTGKTRLSVELAHRLRESHTSVFFVPLADLQEPQWLLERVLESLSAKPDSGIPALEQLTTILGSEPVILVLDNLEQVLPRAASPVLRLMEAIPTLKIVVTSRKLLGISGEEIWPVEPLAVPTTSDPTGAASVDLFLDRARQARSDFRLSDRNAADIAEICRRLEGIPLALELAAARLNTRTASQLLSSLLDRFTVLDSARAGKHRHSSLWLAIDWSYSLLSPTTKATFARLSVFRGGWTSQSALQICEAAEDDLEALRTQSLIQLEGHDSELRYSMLECVRDFAEQKLSEVERASLVVRHAKYFRSLSFTLHEDQRGAEQRKANERFRLEQPNILVAIDRGATDQAPILIDALEIANRNYRYWEMRGSWTQARVLYQSLLLADREALPTQERALALISLSNLMRLQGEAEAAAALTEECLLIREALGDQIGVSSALGHLAQLQHVLGNLELGVELYERCLKIQKDVGADWSHAMNLLNLGWLLVTMDRLDDAEERLTASLHAMISQGDKWGIAAATGNLGEVAFRRGDYAHSKHLHISSLLMFQEIDDLPAIAEELEGIASLELAEKRYETAVKLISAASSLRAEIASTPSPTQVKKLQERLNECRENMPEESFSTAYSEGGQLPLEAVIQLASQEC